MLTRAEAIAEYEASLREPPHELEPAGRLVVGAGWLVALVLAVLAWLLVFAVVALGRFLWGLVAGA